MEKYKEELLSQEYKKMNLETALENYPDLMKKFRNIKNSAIKQIERLDLKKTENKKGERNITVISETDANEESIDIVNILKNINYENIDYLSEVCSNIHIIPILLVLDILDEKVRNVANRSSRWALNKMIKFTNWSFSEEESYGSNLHKLSLFVLYTTRELVRLTTKIDMD